MFDSFQPFTRPARNPSDRTFGKLYTMFTRRFSVASKAVGPLSAFALNGSDGKFAPSSSLPISPCVVSSNFDQVNAAWNSKPRDNCLPTDACSALYHESPSVLFSTNAGRFGFSRCAFPGGEFPGYSAGSQIGFMPLFHGSVAKPAHPVGSSVAVLDPGILQGITGLPSTTRRRLLPREST